MTMVNEGLKVMREGGLRVFFRSIASYFYSYYLSAILMPLAIRKFETAKESVHDVNDAIRFAFSFRFLSFSIRPAELEDEIAKLIEIIAVLRPKYVIEIGRGDGGTLFLFSKAAASDAAIISVDLRSLKWRRSLYKSFEEDRQQIYLPRANSHADTTLQNVRQILDGRKADFLFIDGDHTYDGEKKNFEMYSPLVRGGGIIALHDIAKFPPNAVYEQVNRFWSEIRERYAVWSGPGVTQL